MAFYGTVSPFYGPEIPAEIVAVEWNIIFHLVRWFSQLETSISDGGFPEIATFDDPG